MTPRRAPFAFVVLATLALTACGFHLRREAQLPASMQRVHLEIADASSALAKGLAKALPRSGATLVDDAGGAAVLRIGANTLATDVLSVGGNARATEYALRYHVEFELRDADGASVIAPQTIELTRDFTFDASQSLGVAAQIDLLSTELQQDMVQAVLRRIEAHAHAAP